MPAPVSVVIPNWNGSGRLERTLASLASQTSLPAEILVVDNGSSDSSPDRAARAGARVLKLDRNYGFSRAVNEGINACECEWVAIVNNDVVLEPSWLERLLAACLEAHADYAAPRLLSLNNPALLDGSFDLLTASGLAWRAGHSQPNAPPFLSPCPIRCAPMTALLLRRSLFTTLGGLDERFESYLEDVDFTLRCSLSGFSGIYAPDSVALHQGSATLGPSSPRMVRLLSRNHLFLLAKHFPQDWELLYLRPVLAGTLLSALSALRHRAFIPWLQGKAEALPLLARFRTAPASHSPALRALFEKDRQLFDTLLHPTAKTGFWRWYFRLAGNL